MQHADLTVTVAAPLADAEARLRAALAAEGFGVLTEIDVEGTLRSKLGDSEADEVGPTRILGACNPVLAHRAITTERSVALLLPCNVVVREVEAGTEIAIADPDAMVTMAGDALGAIACDARERLVRVADALRD